MVIVLPEALLSALRSCLCFTCGLLWHLASICSQISCSSARSLTMRLALMLLLAGFVRVYSGNWKQLPVCAWPVADPLLKEAKVYIALERLQNNMPCCLLEDKCSVWKSRNWTEWYEPEYSAMSVSSLSACASSKIAMVEQAQKCSDICCLSLSCLKWVRCEHASEQRWPSPMYWVSRYSNR